MPFTFSAQSSLTHTLLIATPAITEGPFAESVIFIAHHTAEGSMGFVINQPMPTFGFADIARSMGIEELLARGREHPIIFRGGPMEHTRGFIIHSTDYTLPSSVKLSNQFTLSAQADIVADIAKGQGPEQLNFCLGYAGWAPGQLEEELKGNSWLLLPATPELVFTAPPTQRYKIASRTLGLNSNFHPEVIGQA